MDFTEKYIAMCINAKGLQDSYDGSKNNPMCPDMLVAYKQNITNNVIDADKIYWVPRLDQLIEMIVEYVQEHLVEDAKNPFSIAWSVKRRSKGNVYETFFNGETYALPSAEQLILTLYMRVKYDMWYRDWDFQWLPVASKSEKG